MAHIKVFIGYLTNNWSGKRVDVHGRTYRSVYSRFGHAAMVAEYINTNSWKIK